MSEVGIDDAKEQCLLRDPGGGRGGQIMQGMRQPTRRGQGNTQRCLSGRLAFGLLVLLVLAFHAAAAAASAERAVIFYSPG
jgi:hypothetical protein